MRVGYISRGVRIILVIVCVIQGSWSQQNVGSDLPLLKPVIERLFAHDLAPGMGVAVVRDNEITFAEGFGFSDLEAGTPVTNETLFYIASTTKSFTAFAAALMDHERTFDLDRPLSFYLPTVRLHPPLSPDSMSIRDLLDHTHGIENDGPVVFRTAYTGVFTNELLIKLLARHKPSSSGTNFVYGNLGYVVAGLAMESAAGTSWKEIVQRRILNPLEMTSTHAGMDPVSKQRLAAPYTAREEGYQRLSFTKSDANMHAAGGHVSTARDLARWLLVHINKGQLGERQVFPPEVIARTHKLSSVQDRNFGMFHRFGWGLGWDLGTYEGDTLIHRFGSFAGFRSHVSFMPARRIGVVVLVNERTIGSILCDVVAASIYDVLLEKPDGEEQLDKANAQLEANGKKGRRFIGEDRRRRAERPQHLPLPLFSYAGDFENDELGRMEWQIRDGNLEVIMGLARSQVEVYNGPENKFRVELAGGGEVVTMVTEGNTVTGLTYQEKVFTRIRK